jgi:hypothetical protein
MSAKISYVFGDKKSSVVILSDGQALEVRRGEKTRWTSGEERTTWPSMKAWLATLPPQWDSVEAWISAGKRPVSHGEGLLLSSGLAYFIGKERATQLEIEAALDSYTDHIRLWFRQWCDNSINIRVDSFLASLARLHPEITHKRSDVLAGLLERVKKEEPLAPNVVDVVVKEEEVALAVSEVAPSTVVLVADASSTVVPAADAFPNVEDAVVVEEAPVEALAAEEEGIVYPHPEELGGTDLHYIHVIMKSGNDVAYKLARLTDYVSVCMRPEYAAFWRGSMQSRHNLRAIIKTSRVFGACPVAEAFLATYPA